MISELTDVEILDFLMTSDFEENFSPDELKYLLLKWRYFYRILHSRNERMQQSYEFEFKISKEKLETEEKKINELISLIEKKDKNIEELKIRKLSWKERLTGKIIDNENEN